MAFFEHFSGLMLVLGDCRQQYGTRQMETDGNKTEHIETSHQLDGTRKARKLERKRDGKGMRTGQELDGTGRGRKRYGDGNGRERDEKGK